MVKATFLNITAWRSVGLVVVSAPAAFFIGGLLAGFGLRRVAVFIHVSSGTTNGDRRVRHPGRGRSPFFRPGPRWGSAGCGGPQLAGAEAAAQPGAGQGDGDDG